MDILILKHPKHLKLEKKLENLKADWTMEDMLLNLKTEQQR